MLNLDLTHLDVLVELFFGVCIGKYPDLLFDLVDVRVFTCEKIYDLLSSEVCR